MEFLELSRILPICFRKTCHLKNLWSLSLFPLLAWACSICYLVCCSFFLPLIFHCFLLSIEMVTLKNKTCSFLLPTLWHFIEALITLRTKATVQALGQIVHSCLPTRLIVIVSSMFILLSSEISKILSPTPVFCLSDFYSNMYSYYFPIVLSSTFRRFPQFHSSIKFEDLLFFICYFCV